MNDQEIIIGGAQAAPEQNNGADDILEKAAAIQRAEAEEVEVSNEYTGSELPDTPEAAPAPKAPTGPVAGQDGYEPSLEDLLGEVNSTQAETATFYVPELGANGTNVTVRALSTKELSDIGHKCLTMRGGKVVRNPQREAEMELMYKLSVGTVYPKISLEGASKLMRSPKMLKVVSRIVTEMNKFISDDKGEPELGTEGAKNYLLANQVFTLVLFILKREGRLLEFLAGQQDLYNAVCENLPILLALNDVEKMANESGVKLK